MTFLGLAPTVDELAGVRYLFTDVDDTLTTDGQLLPQTYQALWDLHDAGIAIIPVTGGSAGWCEHIVRAWPVARVIGESGAFVAEAETGRVKFDFWESQSGQAERQRRLLAAIAPLLGNSFALAHDQQFRLADVAIDIKGQSREEVDELA
ncbi:MAG TPA: HAD-IIB family hydrolase, partial [Devosia sp.]